MAPNQMIKPEMNHQKQKMKTLNKPKSASGYRIN